jgi:hypothetical protein
MRCNADAGAEERGDPDIGKKHGKRIVRRARAHAKAIAPSRTRAQRTREISAHIKPKHAGSPRPKPHGLAIAHTESLWGPSPAELLALTE